VSNRELSVATALASVRAEGLEPELAVVELLTRWGHGEISDAQFALARKELAAYGSLARIPITF